MDQIFGDLDFVFVYLDDILISSGNQEWHRKHLHEVFDRLHKAGLAINLPKEKTEILGYNGHCRGGVDICCLWFTLNYIL